MKLTLKTIYAIFIILSLFILTNCSAKPIVRYEEKPFPKDEQKEITANKIEIKFEETFDISSFRTEIKLPEKKIDLDKSTNDVWYQYDLKDNPITKTKKIIGTASGFRVQVLATDDLDESGKMMEELKAIKGANEIYSVFEPPFYKILMGDFKSSDEANSLRFKLNQLGYSDSKVVKSTINLFEQ